MTTSRPSRFARGYTRLAPRMDARGAADHRRELVSGLAGTVIEVGCGPGGMFAHYPNTVTEATAIEPDEYLRQQAAASAAAAAALSGITMTVLPGHAEDLPFDDASCDAAVFSLVLCSVADPGRALAEARRVLRPGGQLRFYEHVRSASYLVGLLEDLVTPLWRRGAGGCHPNRDTVNLIGAHGFRVDTVRRFGFSPAPGALPVAHVIGRATASALG